MANNSLTYVSPGVFFTKTDLSYVQQAVGVTTLGLVGETLKGPAFQPVAVANTLEFATRFGAQSTEKFANGVPKYELPYIANSYLEESGQLFVTRVLGLSGYDAGKAWVITASAGIDPATIGVVTTTGTTTFTGNTFANSTINSNVGNFNTLPVTAINSGSTFLCPSATTLSKSGSAFTATDITMKVTAFNGGTGVGAATYTIKAITGTSLSALEGVPVALVRSRAQYIDEALVANTSGLTMSNDAEENALAAFTLTTDTDSLIVSLNASSSNFIGKVLGYGAFDKKVDLYVEDIYNKNLAALVASGKVFGLNSTLVSYSNLNNYKNIYQTPETPFFVSEVRGNKIEKLFKLISISDGDAANSEIKISIENVNFSTGEFDVCIRDFNDTDAYPTYLETFRKSTMNPQLNSFIGKRIGTTDMEYPLLSKYVMVELAEAAPSDAIVAGFEGYKVKNHTGTLPTMLYKTSYGLTEKVKKAYLGISDIVGIDQDIFNYQGENISTGTTAGFHMDSGATGNFVKGNFQFRSDSSVVGTDYAAASARKFTVAPAGGFDGWDIFRNVRTNSDDFQSTSPKFSGFTLSYPSDFYAYLQGINTFANASDIFINLIATPGIDFSNQTALVQEAIDMVQDVRGDCLYLVTAPDQLAGSTAAQDEVDLLDAAGIDATYAASFFPWVQFNDKQNGSNIWLPPTFEYVRLAAKTDNEKAPWFTIAGFNRGQLKSKVAKIKINQDTADILYEGRLNPIRTYGAGSPLMIWGNKTLQVANSALSSIHVVRLLLQIQKLVSNVAVRLVFEPNDTTLQQQFENMVKPILANVKKQRGVIDFEVKCDDVLNTSETRDRLELIGNIRIKPTLAAEYIKVNFGVTDQGATFSVEQ